MDDELVKRLRNRRICIQQSGSLDDFPLLREAADVIEELSAIREEQKAQIILMAAEIEELKIYAELYQSLTDKSQKAARNLLDAYPKWIPVKERLPRFESAVLCMRKSNVYGVRPYQEILYVDEYGFKNYDDIYLADGVVTHWMPLPEPPKEETK